MNSRSAWAIAPAIRFLFLNIVLIEINERNPVVCIIYVQITQDVDEMNEQIEANQKPWEMELNGLDGKIKEMARVNQILN